jgi:hypothetical protein
MSSTFDMSVLLGQRYQWLQIESVTRVAMTDGREEVPLEIGRDVLFDGVSLQAGGLMQCSPAAMLYLPACLPKEHGRFAVRVVYRPLVRVEQNPGIPISAVQEVRAELVTA